MPLVSDSHGVSRSFCILKKIAISTAIVSVALFSGCASKPQINNPTRYASAPNYYTVKTGDTLSGIAARYGLSYLSVAEMNDISAPYRIYVGQSLRLKKGGASKTVTTQPITQTGTIQRQKIDLPKNQTTITQPTTSAIATSAASVQPSNLKWVKPSNGSVIAQFDPANNIKGMRFSGNVGDPVFAAADGQVVYAADGLKEYGNLVLIKHVSGYITAYAHNSKLLVKSDQNVAAGQKIAEMGSSGTTRTMLEFQVRFDGKPIDPQNILPKN